MLLPSTALLVLISPLRFSLSLSLSLNSIQFFFSFSATNSRSQIHHPLLLQTLTATSTSTAKWSHPIQLFPEKSSTTTKFSKPNTQIQLRLAMTWSLSSPLVPTLILLFSLPILYFLLAPSILPSRQITISLPEELDDLSLFHKAIAMDSGNFSQHPRRLPSAKSHLSTQRRPKIAFLFLTNSALHFSPLWERFFANVSHKQYNIYIHADPLVQIPDFQGVFKDRQIPSKRTQRSSPTLISAARRLLATAMLDDPSNAYFALISQHCIPLHSFGYLYNFLFDLGRLSTTDFEFSSYIEILDSESTLWDRYNARGENVMLPDVVFDQFRVGSQFFVLTRKHALMVIKDRKLWRKFKLPCLNLDSCYPEEHYFPTLLSMQDPSKCSHYTLTRVNWTDSVNGHPHTYHPAEVSVELISTLRESNSTFSYMFARKFSPDCLNPLMELAESVIFKD